ncbi:hypothetical protein Tco_0632482 [Tanacetum coccineum]
MLRRKRAGKEQQQKSSKKQRLEEDKESDEVEEVKEDDEAELEKDFVFKKGLKKLDSNDAIRRDLLSRPPVIVELQLLKKE